MYFSIENSQKIDYIRNEIEKWYRSEKINKKEYYYLKACLIESVSKVSNIAGVYGAYLKTWDKRALKEMTFIDVERNDEKIKYENKIYNEKIEKLIGEVECDILYLDPPYTKNQYSTQYHLLETISKYDNPDIKGKTGSRMDTLSNNSLFSKEGLVNIEFERLIYNSNCKYIIFSYSSDGLMSKTFIESVLKRYGKEETYTFKKVNYRRYRNIKASEKEHYEYLFFIEKKDKQNIKYSSPLNYMGNKYEIIDFLKENFPKKIDKFVDLFGGGFNVGINVETHEIIYNDINFRVKELVEMFFSKTPLEIYTYLKKMIRKYKLKKNKKEEFIQVRKMYNELSLEKRTPELLYLLVLFGFNQQLRFNSKLEFNNTVGESGFNDKIFEKILSFSDKLKEKKIKFYSKDFEEIEVEITQGSFVYVDPPYLITLGSYNDGKRGFNGWNEKEEVRLLKFLDRLNEKGIKFMLSNVIEHKDKKNEILYEWIKNKKYKVVKNIEYKKRNEVVIMNY